MVNFDSSFQNTLPDGVGQAMFGHYKILSELGQGGMGKVYKVLDTKINQVVALKVLLSQQLEEKQVKRFFVEAKAMAKLNHPHIIRLYNVGDIQGTYFLTMEYIEGESLKERLKAKKMNFRKNIVILIKVAQAVDYAHSQGIIHRDLKPDNIMLDKEENPYVMDFGLAKMAESSQQLTKTGTIMGTLSYMSPEQAEGRNRDIDACSDIYTLGAILYELATGKRPFSSSSSMVLLKEILLKTPEAPSKLNLRISKNIDKICLKAMAKKKQDRYSSAQEFAKDLQNFTQGKKVSAKLKLNISSMVIVIVVFLLIVLLLINFIPKDKEISQKKSVYKDLQKKFIQISSNKNISLKEKTIQLEVVLSLVKKGDSLYKSIEKEINKLKVLAKKTSNKKLKNFFQSSTVGDFYRLKKSLWTFSEKKASFLSSFFKVDNTLYCSTTQKVYAIDANTGKKKWGFRAAIIEKIHLDGDYIYCNSQEYLYKISRFHGKKILRFNKKDVKGRILDVRLGLVYYWKDNFIFAANEKTKEIVWKESYANPKHWEIYNKRIYLCTNNSFYVIDAIQNKLYWKISGKFSVPPIIKGKNIYCAFDNAFYIINVENGNKQKLLNGRVNSIKIFNKRLLLDTSKEFFIFHFENKWHLTKLKKKHREIYDYTYYNNVFYYSCAVGVIAFDLNQEKEKWYFKAASTFEHLVVDKKNIYIAPIEKNNKKVTSLLSFFYVLDIDSGEIKWLFQPANISKYFSIYNQPILTEKHIYFNDTRSIYSLPKNISPLLAPKKFDSFQKNSYIHSKITFKVPLVRYGSLNIKKYDPRRLVHFSCLKFSSNTKQSVFFKLPRKPKKTFLQFYRLSAASNIVSDSAIDIKINGSFLTEDRVTLEGWETNSWEITHLVREGENQIDIKGKTRKLYWIRSIEIVNVE